MDGELFHAPPPTLEDRTTATSWAHGMKRLAYVSGDQVYIWPLGEPAPYTLQRGDGLPRLTAWSPHGNSLLSLLAVACDDHRIRIWHPHSRMLRATLDAGANPITGLAWAPEGKYLAAGDEGGDVYLWQDDGGRWVRRRKWPHIGKIHALAWSPDGVTLAAACSDGSVALWDRETGKSLGDLSLSGPKTAANAIAWTPDGKTLIVLGGDGFLRFWNVEAKAMLRQVRRPGGPAAFSADGALLAAVSKTYTVRLWETTTGRPLGTAIRLEHGWLVLSETGHYRAENEKVEKELVYVVQTDEGQDTLSPKQFAAKYNWKNEPDKARLDTR